MLAKCASSRSSFVAKTRPWQRRLRCWCCKKSPNHLGGRGRRHEAEERRMILQLIDEAVQSGARREKASALLGLSARALARWRAEGETGDRRCGPRVSPAHKL